MSDGRETRTTHGLAIVNPYGGVWTDEVFETPEKALEYFKKFWGPHAIDMDKFSLAVATKTISLCRAPGQLSLVPWPQTSTST